MSEHIKQRIKYLVEHGGIADDPLTDLRRSVRTLYWLTGFMVLSHLVELAL